MHGVGNTGNGIGQVEMDTAKSPAFSKDPTSENWQRFMILWSVTPEFFIGSCIICVVAIICVFFLTKDDNYNTVCVKSMKSSSSDKHKTADVIRRQTSTDSVKSFDKVNHNSLRNRKNPNVDHQIHLNEGNNTTEEQSENYSDEFSRQIEEDSSSPYKKSLYRMAAEKLEATLTPEQIQEEREIQQQQLKAIFEIMREKNDVFGIEEMAQVEEQMKYYG